MQTLVHPLVIISILIVCFLLLAFIGIYFAVKGIKTANGSDKNDFSSIRKLERRYNRSVKMRERRCVIYINVFLDNYFSLYSEEQTAKVFSEIKVYKRLPINITVGKLSLFRHRKAV